jgi:hypothetical protein
MTQWSATHLRVTAYSDLIGILVQQKVLTANGDKEAKPLKCYDDYDPHLCNDRFDEAV